MSEEVLRKIDEKLGVIAELLMVIALDGEEQRMIFRCPTHRYTPNARLLGLQKELQDMGRP